MQVYKMKAIALTAVLVAGVASANIPSIVADYHGKADTFVGTPEMLLGVEIDFVNISGTTDVWATYVDKFNIKPTSIVKDEVYAIKWKDGGTKKRTSYEWETCKDKTICDFIVDDFLVDMINPREGIAFYKKYREDRKVYFSVKP